MSDQIWKFPLQTTEGVQQVEMPRGALLMSVGQQEGRLRVWVRVFPTTETEIKQFVVVGTGKDIPPLPMYFVGSVQDGVFVWHIFEVVE